MTRASFGDLGAAAEVTSSVRTSVDIEHAPDIGRPRRSITRARPKGHASAEEPVGSVISECYIRLGMRAPGMRLERRPSRPLMWEEAHQAEDEITGCGGGERSRQIFDVTLRLARPGSCRGPLSCEVGVDRATTCGHRSGRPLRFRAARSSRLWREFFLGALFAQPSSAPNPVRAAAGCQASGVSSRASARSPGVS
jgi:hypothetical protein